MPKSIAAIAYDFYCASLYIFVLILSVCLLSLCVCVWAMLPDSNKMMMMMMMRRRMIEKKCTKYSGD